MSNFKIDNKHPGAKSRIYGTTVAHKGHSERQSHNESQSHDESQSNDESQSHDECQSHEESQSQYECAVLFNFLLEKVETYD